MNFGGGVEPLISEVQKNNSATVPHIVALPLSIFIAKVWKLIGLTKYLTGF